MFDKFLDSNKHVGRRNQLVKKLKVKGITSESVLNAISKIPRHLFMDKALEEYAYNDSAYPIDEDQTISQPFTVAFQTQLLKLKKNEKVLEIGTGSGYQTAILSFISNRVYTIERHHKLFKKSKKTLNNLGYRVKKNIFGDGFNGFPSGAPYDAIIVTAGAPIIPKKLLNQLTIGGRIIIPIGEKNQIMTRITRTSFNEFKKESFGEFKFVPLLKNKN